MLQMSETGSEILGEMTKMQMLLPELSPKDLIVLLVLLDNNHSLHIQTHMFHIQTHMSHSLLPLPQPDLQLDLSIHRPKANPHLILFKF